MRLRGGYFSFSTRFSLFARISYLFFELMSRGRGSFFYRRGGCDFLSDQKVTKESLGAAFDERLRAAGAHRRLAPKPPFYGRRPPEGWEVLSGGLRQDLASFLLRGHRPLQGRNLEVSALYAHRLVWQSCGSWAIDDDRTKQVGRHQAVCVRIARL